MVVPSPFLVPVCLFGWPPALLTEAFAFAEACAITPFISRPLCPRPGRFNSTPPSVRWCGFSSSWKLWQKYLISWYWDETVRLKTPHRSTGCDPIASPGPHGHCAPCQAWATMPLSWRDISPLIPARHFHPLLDKCLAEMGAWMAASWRGPNADKLEMSASTGKHWGE